MRAEGEAGALRHALHLDWFRLEAFRGPLMRVSIRGTWSRPIAFKFLVVAVARADLGLHLDIAPQPRREGKLNWIMPRSPAQHPEMPLAKA